MLKYKYFRPEQPPSVDRPKIIPFHASFHHKIILAKLRPWAELVAQPATAGCCLAITVHECSDWLQRCLVNIYAEIIMVALCNRADHYIFCPVISIFYLSSIFFFIPRLISAAADWMSIILLHMAWPYTVRIWNAGLKCAAVGSLQIQDAKTSPKIAIWAPSHNFDGLYLRNKGTYRQSEKNTLSSDTSSTCPYNMVNFSPLAAEIVLLVWGTPANFNGFRVLAALLQDIQ